jgi:hypothetical protein
LFDEVIKLLVFPQPEPTVHLETPPNVVAINNNDLDDDDDKLMNEVFAGW